MVSVKCLIEHLDECPGGVYSAILYGSLVRGDFLPEISDVDIFLILEDGAIPDEIVNTVKSRLSGCLDSGRGLDVVWEWKRDLTSKPYRGYPFKFLTIYREDFKGDHVVLCGKGPLIPEMPFSHALNLRIRHIEDVLEKKKDDLKALSLLSGEVARHIAYLNGSSLDKRDIVGTLLRLEDADGLRIFTAYLEGRIVEDGDFLIRYIEKGVERLKEIASSL